VASRLTGDLTERGLGHDTNYFEQNIGSRHGRQLRIRVIRRGDLHNVSANNMQAIQTADDGAQLSGGPSARLGRTGGRRESRIDGVNINGKVDRLVAYRLADLCDYTRHAKSIDLPRLNPLETRIVVVLVVSWPRERRPDGAVLSKATN